MKILTLRKKFYEDDDTMLLKGNCITVLKYLPEKSIDMIFADPPYFLSNNGTTCKSGNFASVNKGEWDKSKSFREKHLFNKRWLHECYRVLKDTGTIWISGTFHNIYSIGVTLEQENYKILNNITWKKSNPPPNLGCRCFTHSTETIIWAKKNLKKSKHYFDYKLMKELNNDKQMKDVWNIDEQLNDIWNGSTTKKSEKSFGKHPTQKPLYLLEKILMASTKKDDIILDCFMGSGTTGVAAKKMERYFIGIEKEKEYLELAKKRILDIER